MKKFLWSLFNLSFGAFLFSFSFPMLGFAGSPELEQWLGRERIWARTYLERNMSPADGHPGAILASPSRRSPEYYFFWVRDGALAAQTAIDFLVRTKEKKWADFLREFVGLSQYHQETAGLGEPKFFVDGRVYDKEWGRPQNDGPALRAVALIRLAEKLLQGQRSYVEDTLYRVVHRDLLYVTQEWKKPCIDLWEEVWGHHWYTLIVQRRALVDGARLARALGDFDSADLFEGHALQIARAAETFWDESKGFVVATKEAQPARGPRRAKGGLDAAVVLGALHAHDISNDSSDLFFGVLDRRIWSTANLLEKSFHEIYEVNRFGPSGNAIGRYPEDEYYGGNPWVLTTLAFAELHFRAGRAALKRLGKTKGLRVAQKAMEKGDQYLERVRFHSNPDGSLSEQIHRQTGHMESAQHLSWNYAAFYSAVWARDMLVGEL